MWATSALSAAISTLNVGNIGDGLGISAISAIAVLIKLHGCVTVTNP